jgi:hypothetical protein
MKRSAPGAGGSARGSNRALFIQDGPAYCGSCSRTNGRRWPLHVPAGSARGYPLFDRSSHA